MNSFIVRILSPILKFKDVVLENPHMVTLLPGLTCVIGPNGSGKTTFANVIHSGRFIHGNNISFSPFSLKSYLISFTDIHSLGGIDVQYATQRLEATMNEYVPDVKAILGQHLNSVQFKELSQQFNLYDVEDKKINYLSSGELRKLVFIKALLAKPDLIIIDNPFIGLDPESRSDLENTLHVLTSNNTSILLILSDPQEIPENTDHVIEIKDNIIYTPLSYNDWKMISSISDEEDIIKITDFPERPSRTMKSDYYITFSIKNGHAVYGETKVFSHFDWTVRKGECWALKGQNGSGKSLLLSMVCADNPQSYSNDIILFDRQRGTGESIWEIKNNISYVSPEMHNYFRSNETVSNIILMGLRNSLTRYKQISDYEKDAILYWLQLLNISHLSERSYSTLSSGEKRMVLVARALIRQPELLILDEPFHGLDQTRKKKLKNIIDNLMKKNGTSLIIVTHNSEELPSCITNYKQMPERQNNRGGFIVTQNRLT